MEADLSRRIYVLRREYLFQGLEPAQLSRVASVFDERRVAAGEMVFAQGDAPDNFYIILDGRVRVSRQDGERTRQLNVLGPGDYFGEQALLFNDLRSASVQAETDCLLLRLDQDKFQVLLGEYPQMRPNLAATAESRNLVRRLYFPWLDKEDEVIYLIARKHYLFLLTSLAGPVISALIGLAAWTLFGIGGGALGAQFGVYLLAVPLLIIVGWGIWNGVDWSNDYYIVTNQRVVWQEKVVMLYDSRTEAPLNTIVAVNITTSWLGRIFDFGNVEVRTFTGVIAMKKMARPYLFASFVEGYKKRVQAISREQEEREIETALRAALQKSISPPEVQSPAGEAPKPGDAAPFKPPPPPKRDTFTDDLKRALQTFLKIRYQDGKIITYRKHYLLLLRDAGLPFLLNLLVFFGLGWSLIARQYPIALGLSLVFLVALGWLIYAYLDWSNDIYRLTPEQIIDIEKKPLGQEQKKTSNLDAPDFRVEHERKTIINILFNFGDVVINIGQTQFTFNGVYNPDQVHQDVANYRSALQRKKQEEESKRDRDKMVNWLVAYYNQMGNFDPPESFTENRMTSVITAGISAGADPKRMIAAAAQYGFDPKLGMQPSKAAEAYREVFGNNVNVYDNYSLRGIWNAFQIGAMIIVDILVYQDAQTGIYVVGDGEKSFSYYGRILGIDKEKRTIYIENTLRGKTWAVFSDDFMDAWSNPEIRAKSKPDVPDPDTYFESVTYWTAVIRPGLIR